MGKVFPLFLERSPRRLGSVNRLSKGILAGLGLTAGALLLLALGLRATLQSDYTRKRLQEALSEALHMNVQFQQLRPTFFNGCRLTELMASREGGSCIQARELFVRPRLSALLRGQLVLCEIHIDSARVVFVSPPPTPSLPSPALASGDKLQEALRAPSARFAVEKVGIENSALQWIDRAGKTVVQLEGVHLRLQQEPSGEGKGSFQIKRGVLSEVLPFHHLEAPVEIREGSYRVPRFEAVCGGGKLSGALEARPSGEGIPFLCNLQAREIDLARITAEQPSVQSTGIFQGTLSLSGQASRLESLVGEASFSLHKGVLKGLHLLQSLGQIFQISELATFQVQEARGQLRLRESQIRLLDFALLGGDMALHSQGLLGLDQSLQLDVKLQLPERMLNGKIAQMVSDRFSAPDAQGLRSILFQVTGTTANPRTNLLEKLVGENLGGAVQKILGGFLKPKKTDAAPPPPAPR
jgi:hypothetical protein